MTVILIITDTLLSEMESVTVLYLLDWFYEVLCRLNDYLQAIKIAISI